MAKLKLFLQKPIKDIFISLLPSVIVICLAIFLSHKYLDPEPPKHLVIGTGEVDGDYQAIARQYQEILKKDGITLEIHPTTGPLENLKLLQDENSDVDVGFVQDGIGSQEEQPDVRSLGSLYYEPIWLFYRGPKTLTRFSDLKGKKIAIGRPGHETRILTQDLLMVSGVNEQNSQLINIGMQDAFTALDEGKIDAAFFMLQPDDAMLDNLMRDPKIHLMNLDQAEAYTRRNSTIHHLVLPHGAISIRDNSPAEDVHLLATTTTLLASNDLHPALAYLLLKAAKQVHSAPGVFEKKNEFPAEKDDNFPLSSEAKQFYSNGGPFWQHYLPFWLAVWVNRFFIIVIPAIAIIWPLVKAIPQFYDWRMRKKLYKFYGQLRYLETVILSETGKEKLMADLKKLDTIEESINKVNFPLNYVEHTYSLRGHIHFVRERIKEHL